MEYKLVPSKEEDLEKLKEYKKKNIYEYAKDLLDEEYIRIENYVNKEVPKQLKDYYNIVVNNKKIGCVLTVPAEDGILLDEIYIEEEYRNYGIGSSIIKNILSKNNIVYLWAYKDNKKAISLYKRLGFKIIKDTDFRYQMKYDIEKK